MSRRRIKSAPSSNRSSLLHGDASQSRSADSRSLRRVHAARDAAGTQLLNALPPRRRTARRVSRSSSVGIVPDRRLFSSCSSSKCDRLPSESMVPRKPVFSNASTRRLAKSVNCCTRPVNSLFPSRSETSPCNAPSSSGIVPISALSSRFRVRSPDRVPSSGGMDPASRLWPSRSTARASRADSAAGIRPFSPICDRSRAITRGPSAAPPAMAGRPTVTPRQ